MSLRTALALPFERIASTIAGRKAVEGKAAAEGSVRPGPWNLPYSGVTWSVGPPSYGGYINGWQMGGEPWVSGPRSGVVEACLALYAGTLAMLPVAHFIRLPDGGKARVDSSDASRIFLEPNSYQTWADFVGEATRCLFTDGNFYALATRNHRGEVDALHPMDPLQSQPLVVHVEATVDEEKFRTQELAYSLAGNDFVDNDPEAFGGVYGGNRRGFWPARNVLHCRLPSYNARKPNFLIGQSPLISLVGAEELIRRPTAMLDQKRPLAVASLDHSASREQVAELRERIKEGLHNSIPVMSAGAKLEPWSGGVITPKDLQLIEWGVVTREEILAAMRVPGALLGLDKASTGTTRELIAQWRQMGVAPTVEIFEQTLSRFFRLRGWPHEWIEFDLDALSRGDERERVETLARYVQSGIYSPNEARNREDLGRVPFGDEPRVQQQNVPLSAAASIPQAPVPTPTLPPAPPAGGQPPVIGETASARPRIRKIARLTAGEEAERLERLIREAP